MADLFRLSASEAAARIREGKLTSEALVRSCLERIDARESLVKAWVHLDRDFALAQARECDRSASRGPLHGVPFAAKDIMDTADLPTEYGSPIYKGNRPKADAACVALSRAAGGVLLGKTVTTEFASRFPWGKTTNPHNPQHTPGGSSSGSAAAVGDFMVPLAFGTQTVGSVIRPAAFCGCIGYKPSAGLLGRSGIQPFSPTLDQVGVFTRSVEDAALAVAALIGPDPDDVASDAEACGRARLWPLAPSSAPPRLAAVRSPVWGQAEPAQQELFVASVARLRAAGASVEEVELPAAFGAAHAVQRTIMYAEGARTLGTLQAEHRAALSDALNRLIDEGRAIGDTALATALAERRVLQDRLARFLAGYDAIVTPPARGEAPATREHTGDPVFCTIWTLVAAPALTLPAGRGPQGLPLGLQVVGAAHDDAQMLAAARWIERALDEPRAFPAL